MESWGKSCAIDLYDCDKDLLKNPEFIQKFVKDLIDLIGMKAHGPLQLDRFGDGITVSEGWSFMQFIETSSVTGHLCEESGRAFIDIFSCSSFDPRIAEHFCKNKFKGKVRSITILERK